MPRTVMIHRRLLAPSPLTGDRVGYAELLDQFGWTPDDFSQAGLYNFPAPLGRRFTGAEIGEPVYSRARVAEWSSNLSAFAKRLRVAPHLRDLEIR